MIRVVGWRRPALTAAALITCLAIAPGAGGFVVRPEPPASGLFMNLDLGDAPFPTRGYGLRSWNSLALMALGRWNGVGIGPTRDQTFFGARNAVSPGDPCHADGVNEVRFAPDLCGFAWGDILATTMEWSINGKVIETDVIFNPTGPIDAYPGAIVASSGKPIVDFYRLALHEFGHAAGLDHPNLAGQNVRAVMNQGVNQGVGATVDDLQPDDIAGAGAVPWPPGADTTGQRAGFVSGFYHFALGRAASDYELAVWSSYLASNPNTAGVSAFVHAFFDGAEYQARPITPASHVRNLYRAMLGRDADPSGEDAFGSLTRSAYRTLLPGFVTSPEFLNLYGHPGGSSATCCANSTALFTHLYERALGRSPTAFEVDSWTAYRETTQDNLAVVSAFLDSPEYLAAPRSMREHVTVLYRALLDRDPAPSEVEAWVAVLVAQLAPIEDLIIQSPEFQGRFHALFP